MDTGQILQLVRDAGVSGLLVIALIGGFRQWWVFGWQHRLVVKEKDEWKALALQGTTLSEESLHVARGVLTPTREVDL